MLRKAQQAKAKETAVNVKDKLFNIQEMTTTNMATTDSEEPLPGKYRMH